MWGFVCEGAGLPNFHFTTQDHLHRLRGWGQFAGIQHHGRTTMAFQVFVSQYDAIVDETGIPRAHQAYLDFKLAIGAQGYRLDRHASHRLPAVSNRDTLVAVQYLGQQDLVVMAARSGNWEVEGIALYTHQSPTSRATAWASLVRQIEDAEVVMSAHLSA